MNGKELILANAFVKLDDEKYIGIFKSVNDPDFVIGDEGRDRYVVQTGIFYFEPYKHESHDQGIYYNVTTYQFMDSMVNINLKVAKTFLSGHFRKFYKNMFP